MCTALKTEKARKAHTSHVVWSSQYVNGRAELAGVTCIGFEPFFDMNLRDEFIYEMNYILNCGYEVK